MPGEVSFTVQFIEVRVRVRVMAVVSGLVGLLLPGFCRRCSCGRLVGDLGRGNVVARAGILHD